MKRTSREIFAILILCLIGTFSIILGSWIYERHLSETGAWTAIIILFGIFFISLTWALIRLMRWRDENQRVVNIKPMQPRPGSEGTVYGLIPGAKYKVSIPFTDFYGNSFIQGEVLLFRDRHFLPYDGGHTVIFDRKTLYLQEDQNREILDNFSLYFTEEN
ncbi:MAG: DUF3601 domain-containing protein [Anaerolineales bacterium]|nr:DUF3601 domain-containing protein [Anaerolineales bacterium]